MRRPFGLWLLIAIVTIWIKVEDVYSVRATALIFGKTTTTTTTVAPSEASDDTSEEGVTESSSPEGEAQNTTRQLTGIPQIDYRWDPNLPRELNGYNLSQYPFYDRVPDVEEIDFKCDGLHDGFYASVPHKCQVYHHCLFGVRYDFLCANYTAFDQKTFICHFVSEVDCVNSKKFWHRNDALYQAASTTTPKPPPPPPPPVYTIPANAATPVQVVPVLARRPERPRRPILRRPRPYEYYDEEYDDEDYYEKPARRQRPRYRPRVYDDEYEDYEEEDYVRRPNGRRRPYKSRGSNRRRPQEDEEYEDEEDSKKQTDRSKTEEGDRRPPKRRPAEDQDYDRRTHDRPRKKKGHRRPVVEDEYEDDLPPRRASDRRKYKNRDDSRKRDDEGEEEQRPRKSHSRDERPRKSNDRKKNDDSRPNQDKNRNQGEETVNNESAKNERNRDNSEYDENKPLPKPPASIYDRKRPNSKIRPPVPAHERSKYLPKTTTTEPPEEDYYYDEEEDDRYKEESKPSYASKDSKTVTSTTESSAKRGKVQEREPEVEEESEVTTKREYRKKEVEEDETEETTKRERPKRPKYSDESFGNKERRTHFNRRPVLEDEDNYEENRNVQARNKLQKVTTTTTTTTREPPPREPVVKILKRPFLPSRGGNPYASRGLLPVGSKSIEASYSNRGQNNQRGAEEQEDRADDDGRTPLRNGDSKKQQNNQRSREDQEEERKDDEERVPIRGEEPRPNRPATRVIKIITTTTSTTTTEAPKQAEKNPLDLDENEYDVTLNDALNPTLPNLPVRNFPTGFSAQNDYNAYNAVQRPRYIVDPVVNQASTDYVYRIEQPEAVSNNIRYKAVPVYQNIRQAPRITQAIYSPF